MAKTKPTAFQRLRADILDGTLPPGERLVEMTLAERYSVGRGSIRSALLELRGEGLVDIEANRGAVVRRITLDEAIEIAQARRVLEGLLAARAAGRSDDEARESLRAIIEDMRDAVSTADSSRYSELNRTLHRRIWEIGRHRIASELAANLRDRSAHHQFRLAVMPGRSADSLEQHAVIVEAIVAGDSAAAEVAMHRHLDSVIEVLGQWSELGINV